MLYKVVQRFGVTCLFTGQYDTDLLWHITDVISTQMSTQNYSFTIYDYIFNYLQLLLYDLNIS